MAVAYDTAADLGTLAVDGTVENVTLGSGVKAVFYAVARHATTSVPTVTEVRWGSSSGTLFTKVDANYVISDGQSMHIWYSLNSDIPGSGSQNIWTDNATASCSSMFVSYTAGADVDFTLDDADINSASVENPSGSIALGGVSSAVGMIFMSGQNAVTGTTESSGWTNRVEGDRGSNVNGIYTYDTVGTADVTYGWTQTADDARAVAIAVYEIGGGAFTLTADTGTFTLTGQAANLTAARKITADAATFSLTGQAANFVRGYAFPAEVGVFTFSGIAVNLLATRKIAADAGTFALTGIDATLTKTTVGAFTLTADPGSFTYTGQAANLLATRQLAADVGTFTLTGNAATLTKSTAGAYTLTCDTASFAVTASAAGLIATRVMPAVTGSFALTGNSAAFVYGRAVVAEPGSFALTGNDATLRAPIRLTCDTGTFTLTGRDASLTYSGYVQPLAVELLIAAARDTTLTAAARDTTLEARYEFHG